MIGTCLLALGRLIRRLNVALWLKGVSSKTGHRLNDEPVYIPGSVIHGSYPLGLCLLLLMSIGLGVIHYGVAEGLDEVRQGGLVLTLVAFVSCLAVVYTYACVLNDRDTRKARQAERAEVIKWLTDFIDEDGPYESSIVGHRCYWCLRYMYDFIDEQERLREPVDPGWFELCTITANTATSSLAVAPGLRQSIEKWNARIQAKSRSETHSQTTV